MHRSVLTSFLLASCGILFLAPSAEGQIFDKLKKKVKEEAEERLDRTMDQGVEAGFNAVEGAVVCAVTDTECIEAAEADGKTVQVQDEEGRPVAGGAAAAARPGEGAWANYDFVPGERVLFAEDFSDDRVGDFPRRLELLGGNWDVVEWQGQRLLRSTGPRHAAVTLPLPETLPERFTIEFDAFFPHGNQSLVIGTVRPDGRNYASYPANFFRVDGRGSGVDTRHDAVKAVNKSRAVNETLVPVRIMADGEYVKMYIGEQRVANVPNAQFERGREIYLENAYFADQENPMVFGNFRVAAGGADLYDRLETDGRVATQGIYFDTGSDRIRPESTPTLEEIASALADHPELSLTIEGHTDSVGDDGDNQALSERRARAVVAYLVERRGIDASRLDAVGKGESEPVADNDSPEGRQQNRRVELVKR